MLPNDMSYSLISWPSLYTVIYVGEMDGHKWKSSLYSNLLESVEIVLAATVDWRILNDNEWLCYMLVDKTSTSLVLCVCLLCLRAVQY